MYPCNQCTFSGTQINALKKHISEIHEGTELKCDKCPYVNYNKTEFHHHKRNHEEALTFKCTICDQKLQSKDQKQSLKRHMNRCHGGKPGLCELCHEVLENNEMLRLHRRTHRSCAICQATCTNFGNLTQHMKTHSAEKKFQCDECDKFFTRGSILKRHKVIHSGIKSFQCDDCYKSFKYLPDLKVHKAKDEARKCKLCGVPFSRSAQLQKHMEEKHKDIK